MKIEKKMILLFVETFFTNLNIRYERNQINYSLRKIVETFAQKNFQIICKLEDERNERKPNGKFHHQFDSITRHMPVMVAVI